MRVERVGRPSPGAPGRLRARLAAYSRYAAVVQEQLRALEEEDLDRFSELSDHRAEIQEELASEAEDVSEEEMDPETRALLDEARRDVGAAVAQDEEIASRLLRLRAEMGGQIRALSSQKGNARRYLTESEKSQGDRPARLNVRL